MRGRQRQLTAQVPHTPPNETMIEARSAKCKSTKPIPVNFDNTINNTLFMFFKMGQGKGLPVQGKLLPIFPFAFGCIEYSKNEF